MEYAVRHIVASVVLHNFTILGRKLPVRVLMILLHSKLQRCIICAIFVSQGFDGDESDVEDLPDDQRPADIAEAFHQARGPGAVKREHTATFMHPQDDWRCVLRGRYYLASGAGASQHSSR